MGMGYGAGYAYVISQNKIKQVCPIEYKAFFKEMKKSEVSLDSFAQFVDQGRELEQFTDYDEASEVQGRLVDLWTALQTAFHKKSNGLTLELGFHDSDNEGDRYDDINGTYFSVGGMYQLTKAGKKFQRSVKQQFFVTFG
jgi:hypothetical protein